MEIEHIELIKLIHNQSRPGEDKLAEFMKIYHLKNLRDSTVEQLRDYIINHCSISMDKPELEMGR